MAGKTNKSVKSSGTASPTRTRMKVSSTQDKGATITEVSSNIKQMAKLTPNEMAARQIKKYATTGTGFNSRSAYGSGDTSGSAGGNFYSPQLSTDFLEKPQNLRERRAWYRHFYNSNEFVGQAVDLHSQLPLSKIRLEKPKCSNQDMVDYIYDYYVEMCEDLKLFKTLLEISHEFWLLGNCVSPECRVRTEEGYKPIRDISIGDMVLTHKNRFRRVSKKCCREAEEIYDIRLFKSMNNLKITGEHPIEVYRGGSFEFIETSDLSNDDYVRVTWSDREVDRKSVSYIPKKNFIEVTANGYKRFTKIIRNRNKEAQDCRVKLLGWLGSLEAPVVRSRQDISEDLGVSLVTLNNVLSQLTLEVGKESYSRRIGSVGFGLGSRTEWLPLKYDAGDGTYEINRVDSFEVPKEIEIDEDFCYLLGYWIGDGTLSRDNGRKDSWGRGIWNIVFGDSSKKQLSRVRDILIKKLGISAIKEWELHRDYNGRKSTLTTLKVKGNPAFIEWWSSNFGETCYGYKPKRVPQWVKDLPVEKLIHLIAGMVDSDGCIENIYVKIDTVSKDLAESLNEISLKCGFIPSTRKYVTRPEEAKILKGKTLARNAYTVSLLKYYCKDSLEGITEKALGVFKKPSESSSRFLRTDDGKVAFKVKSISLEEHNDMVYNIEVEEDHTYQVEGTSTHNCFIFAEDHEPYEGIEEDKAKELKEAAKIQSGKLFQEFKIVDKDPNYKGWKKLLVLPPDQVRIRKIPLSDDSLIEYIPDPETRKSIVAASNGQYSDYLSNKGGLGSGAVPDKLIDQIRENGSIPLDSDPYSGSHVFHLARKKSQYETLGVSILERCVNTLLLFDKLRQAQTQIASRHMTPIRIVWADELSEGDVDDLREQVDLALMDPDFSIIANYEVHWEEMGSNGRLLELSTEYDHIENSLFAGLGVTREMLTGEGTYAGNRVTLEILNTQYLLFRELLQDYVENNLFKPIAKKKGFVETDKYGREKLVYPKLSFTRLAIRDNDAYFDQTFQLYNKGSVSIDVILDMLNLDPEATKRKVEADLFTVNDFAFNQLISNAYSAVAQPLVDQYDLQGKLADYLGLPAMPEPEGGEEGGEGGLGEAGGGGTRFASDKSTSRKPTKAQEAIEKRVASMDEGNKKALNALIRKATESPEKLAKIKAWLDKGDLDLTDLK